MTKIIWTWKMNKDRLTFFCFNNLWLWYAAHVRSTQLQWSGDEPGDKCTKNRLSVACSYCSGDEPKDIRTVLSYTWSPRNELMIWWISQLAVIAHRPVAISQERDAWEWELEMTIIWQSNMIQPFCSNDIFRNPLRNLIDGPMFDFVPIWTHAYHEPVLLFVSHVSYWESYRLFSSTVER